MMFWRRKQKGKKENDIEESTVNAEPVVIHHSFQDAWDENHKPYPKGTTFIKECKYCNSRENLIECTSDDGSYPTGCGAYLCENHREHYPLCDACYRGKKSYEEGMKWQAQRYEELGIESIWSTTVVNAPLTVKYSDGHDERKSWQEVNELLGHEDRNAL